MGLTKYNWVAEKKNRLPANQKPSLKMFIYTDFNNILFNQPQVFCLTVPVQIYQYNVWLCYNLDTKYPQIDSD